MLIGKARSKILERIIIIKMKMGATLPLRIIFNVRSYFHDENEMAVLAHTRISIARDERTQKRAKAIRVTTSYLL